MAARVHGRFALAAAIERAYRGAAEVAAGGRR